MPVHFNDDMKDDMFMNKMITSYAKEARDKVTGKPNGKFYLDKEAALAASREVLQTHKNLKGKVLDDYLKDMFEETWKFYDTAHDGLIEADRMTTFFRYLCKDARLNIQ